MPKNKSRKTIAVSMWTEIHHAGGEEIEHRCTLPPQITAIVTERTELGFADARVSQWDEDEGITISLLQADSFPSADAAKQACIEAYHRHRIEEQQERSGRIPAEESEEDKATREEELQLLAQRLAKGAGF